MIEVVKNHYEIEGVDDIIQAIPSSKKINIEELDFIIATSVVSHGVNLPSIGRVIFLYRVQNTAHYIQMLGRGGRRGESVQYHVLNFNYFSKSKLMQAFINAKLYKLRHFLAFLSF